MSDDIETRPKDSNADAWHLFLSAYLDARANSPSGLTFMAVQIADAIDDAERRGASSNLPCGHHVSCLVKSVESDSQFCGFCDVMSQRTDAETMEERYRRDRDSLRKALDDRWAADLKAAKAIFAETGRTSGFPSVKGVVSWHVAEVERLEKEMDIATERKRLSIALTEQLLTERASLRAKLDRAKEALTKVSECDVPRPVAKAFRMDGKNSKNDCCPHGLFMYEECAECSADFARAALSALSADAPAQPTHITPPTKEWCERMSQLEGDHEIGAGLLAIDPEPSDEVNNG
jgi:hypothetical protein